VISPASTIEAITSLCRSRAPFRLPVGASRLGAWTSPASRVAWLSVSVSGSVLK